MHIRPERETEREAIHRLVYDAFLGHPQHAPGALPTEPALVGGPNYYIRFDFKADPALALPGVPPQYVLILPLQPPTPTGNLVFHPAFGG